MDTTGIRQARAQLATLFEPDHLHLRDYVELFGPLEAFHKMTTGQTGVSGLHADPVGYDVLAAARQADVRVVIPEDPDWPGRLIGAHQPLCLWVRGDLPDLDSSVTITGSRAATAYGRHVAADLGYGLAAHSWTVVNTAGFGIDAAALSGAMLIPAIPVVAAQPCGLDRPHPNAMTALLDAIASTGAVISMWPPGTQPTRRRAAVNGRLLAALTAGTVLVEAHGQSRTLDILRHAADLDRIAMTIPGPVTSTMSTATNNAARDLPGVRVVTTADQIRHELTHST